jgi:hypothetical protein
MMKATRARYTPEFKQKAVRLVGSGDSMAAASRTWPFREDVVHLGQGPIEKVGCRLPTASRGSNVNRRADGDQPFAGRTGARTMEPYSTHTYRCNSMLFN